MYDILTPFKLSPTGEKQIVWGGGGGGGGINANGTLVGLLSHDSDEIKIQEIKYDL